MEDQPVEMVLTDTSTAYALSLQQRINHPETTPEERERLQAELDAIHAQWAENMRVLLVQIGEALWSALSPAVQAVIDLCKRFFPQPKPLFPVKDKRAWQHSQKLRAQLRRQRRERAKHRTALAYQYRAKRSAG